MAEIGYVLFFLATWFVVPYVLGTWFFKMLKKRWKIFSSEKGAARYVNYGVFLLCALAGWFIETLVLTGLKMIFMK